jgi:hypothetical protein
VAPAAQGTSSLGAAETRIGAVIAETTPERDPRTLEQETEQMMRFFMAYVRNGRLVLDKPTNLPEGRRVELVSIEDVLSNGGELIAQDLDAAFAEEEAGQLVDTIAFNTVTDEHDADAITSDNITDEHVRWYQESMPDSPTTRDVITAATSALPVLRWLGRRRIAAAINARAKAVK